MQFVEPVDVKENRSAICEGTYLKSL